MKCIIDGCDGNLRVKHNYHRKNYEITRRRICDKCGYIYDTVEMPRGHYDIDKKLIDDLRKALIKHRDRKQRL